jgi:hypothetical protein
VDPGSRFRVLVTKNVTKKIPAGKSFFYFIKKMQLFIPRPPYRTSKLQEKLSALKRENPALQTRNYLAFFYICGLFVHSWIRIQPTKNNLDPAADPKH